MARQGGLGVRWQVCDRSQKINPKGATGEQPHHVRVTEQETDLRKATCREPRQCATLIGPKDERYTFIIMYE